jgi:uncharacterized membrane protein
MSPDAKLEAKIVRTLARFLVNEQVLIRRWRVVGKASIFLGSLLWALAILAYAQNASAPWIFAALSGVGGLCLGLGLWFSTFVTQWPVVRQFIDAEKVRQRAIEIDDQGPK